MNSHAAAPRTSDASHSLSQSPGWRFLRLAQKELRETLRDRRTIITLLLMPVLVYPVLGIALQQFALSGSGNSAQVVWRIGAERSDDLTLFQQMLDIGDRHLRNEAQTPELPEQDEASRTADRFGKKPTESLASKDSAISPKIEFFETSDIDARLKDLEIDLGVRRRRQSQRPSRNSPVEFDLHYRANMPLSREVAEYVAARLRAFNEVQFRDRLEQAGEPTAVAAGWRWQPIVQEAQSGFSIAALAPIVLILMTITGAVYPAIDLTAGERERGTLEALMAAPVPRLSLLGAKYVAVVTVAMLTAVANLVAMSITLRGTGLGDALLGPQGMSITVVLQIFLLLSLFAAFFSAVLLAITSFARSFKEAQAYLIPLMLLSLGPGFVSVLPGLELEGLLSITPLVNMVLLARDVMQGAAEPLPASVAVLSTILYAIAALAVAARIFGSDSVLYGSEGSWSDIFNKPERPQATASVGGAWLTAAIVYPLYFAATGLLSMLRDQPVASQIALAGLSTVVVFGLVPWFAASRQRLIMTSGFQLRLPPVLSLVGALLLGVSLWPLAHELFVLAGKLGIGTISPETLRRLAPQVEERLAAWRDLSPVLILAAFALAPALFEEFFFRGYLLGALRNRWPAWAAILATAVLFGVFHLSVGGLAAAERVVTSTFLGLVLGWMCWTTGSIWPGVVTHSLHNGLLLSLAYWKDRLPWGQQAAESGHLPTTWIMVAAIGTLCGFCLVYLGRSASSRNVTSST